MRNFIACLLLLGLLAGLSACGADDSYLSVRPHIEPSIPATETPQQEEPPTAGNRSELRGAMLSFVRNWTEQGEIRISGYSGDLTADLTETVRYPEPVNEHLPQILQRDDFACRILFHLKKSPFLRRCRTAAAARCPGTRTLHRLCRIFS